MAQKETAQQKEKRLNELYSDIFSEGQAEDHFIYLTNKSRGKHTTLSNIRKHFVNHELGTLLRTFDPIAI